MTRCWEKAEDFRRKLEEEYEAKQQGLEEGHPAEACSRDCQRGRVTFSELLWDCRDGNYYSVGLNLTIYD